MSELDHPISDPAVKAVFEAYPQQMRAALLELRALILSAVVHQPQIGPITETLKWGQASYLPSRPRVGTTLRIDAVRNSTTTYALLFHCQSRLADEFRETYPDRFDIVGNRAMHFEVGQKLPARELGHCVALALTYHTRKR